MCWHTLIVLSLKAETLTTVLCEAVLESGSHMHVDLVKSIVFVCRSRLSSHKCQTVGSMKTVATPD